MALSILQNLCTHTPINNGREATCFVRKCQPCTMISCPISRASIPYYYVHSKAMVFSTAATLHHRLSGLLQFLTRTITGSGLSHMVVSGAGAQLPPYH